MRTLFALLALLPLPAFSQEAKPFLKVHFGMKVGDVGEIQDATKSAQIQNSGQIFYKVVRVEKEWIEINAIHWQKSGALQVEPVNFIIKGIETKDLVDGQAYVPSGMWKVTGTQKIGSRTLLVVEPSKEPVPEPKIDEKELAAKKALYRSLAQARYDLNKKYPRPNKDATSEAVIKWVVATDEEWKKVYNILKIKREAADEILKRGDTERWPKN